jgi:HK97 family phage portal protein
MVHGGQSGLFSVTQLLPATKIDYARKVGDGLRSSVLAAPFNWIARNFPQAVPVVDQLEENEQWERVPRHPMTELLRRPNDFYSGHTMFMALSVDICWGNAYLLKIRNQADEVIQLWYVPRGQLVARWPRDGSDYISHYEYTVGGIRQRNVRSEDVIHFRFGIDPRDIRLGLSQVGSLMREVYTDDEAANFAGSILKNMGIIGVVISPKEGGTASKEDVKELKNYLQQAFTGDKRGEMMAVGSPTDVKVMQYDMKGFDISPIRDIAEERVCAALGIPAAVVGFGTGLQQTKVGATMKEMRKMAWEDGIIPMQGAMAEDLEQQLLPDFEDDTSTTRVKFDTSNVAALQQEEAIKHEKIRKDVAAGIITVAQGQALLGYPVDPKRDVYLQPVNIIQLPDGVVPTSASED